MSAAMYGLSNLVAFTDYNKMQIDGTAEAIMKTDRLADRWTSFGWYTQQVDGHDFDALDGALRSALEETSRPSMIIADTIKGKGIPFAEGDFTNHNMPVTQEQAQEAYESLAREEEALA